MTLSMSTLNLLSSDRCLPQTATLPHMSQPIDMYWVVALVHVSLEFDVRAGFNLVTKELEHDRMPKHEHPAERGASALLVNHLICCLHAQ